MRDSNDSRRQILLAVVVPFATAAALLVADVLEGPRAAYVGVLAVVPVISAIFGTPLQTAIVGLAAWLAALGFGLVVIEPVAGAAQVGRLVIIAIAAVLAVALSRIRQRRDASYLRAMQAAQRAEDLRRISLTDELTGLLNRRGALERISEIRAQDADAVVTLALVDCDDLKRVNDELGHQAGDEYLTAIAARFAKVVSSDDVVARWGGDEFLFAVRLPLAGGQRVLERALEAIRANVVATSAGPIRATVSIGACGWEPQQEFDEVLSRADAALYRVKGEGGDRISIA